MSFNTTSFFTGVGAAFAAIAIGFAGGFTMGTPQKADAPNRLERVASSTPLARNGDASPADQAAVTPPSATPQGTAPQQAAPQQAVAQQGLQQASTQGSTTPALAAQSVTQQPAPIAQQPAPVAQQPAPVQPATQTTAEAPAPAQRAEETATGMHRAGDDAAARTRQARDERKATEHRKWAERARRPHDPREMDAATTVRVIRTDDDAAERSDDRPVVREIEPRGPALGARFRLFGGSEQDDE